jgi:hypothetical protein
LQYPADNKANCEQQNALGTCKLALIMTHIRLWCPAREKKLTSFAFFVFQWDYTVPASSYSNPPSVSTSVCWILQLHPQRSKDYYCSATLPGLHPKEWDSSSHHQPRSQNILLCRDALNDLEADEQCKVVSYASLTPPSSS